MVVDVFAFIKDIFLLLGSPIPWVELQECLSLLSLSFSVFAFILRNNKQHSTFRT